MKINKYNNEHKPQIIINKNSKIKKGRDSEIIREKEKEEHVEEEEVHLKPVSTDYRRIT